MSKVFISRPDGNVPWGFRLQGGFEYNEPFTLTNIIPNSPADGKIDPGDMLLEIAGNNITHMTHTAVLELIKQCGDALYLTLHKVGSTYPLYDTSSSSLPMPIENIPPAPIFDVDLIANTTNLFKNQQSIDEIETTEISNIPAVLAKMFGNSSGPKPFTYIPGGLDLSKIRESARTRRLRQDSQEFDEIMNRRTTLPNEHMNQHHYTNINPIQPFSYARQQPIPPKKYIEHDTDVITQSRSFQMLQGWISDSEKSVPMITPSTNTSIDTFNDRHSISSGLSSLPSRSFRYLQEQYSTDNDDNNNNVTINEQKSLSNSSGSGLRRSSDAHMPSRSFKYLQNQYNISDQSQTVNNRNDLMEIYNKTPASFREREPEAPRYTGSTVPSRSFRFLQMMTQDNSEPITTYTKPQQTLLNKYDEHNLSININKLNEHPSRSFKYLQTLTGEKKLPINQTETQIDKLTNEINSTHFGISDY